jgi:hypothetical protein
LHPAPFHIDHVIARQHGGATEFESLALACIHCNRFKGPNVAGVDPSSGDIVRLFNAGAIRGRTTSVGTGRN